MERTHASRTEPSPPPDRRVIATDWARRTPDWYRVAAQAAHEERCDHCRTLTEEAAAFAAANGESIRRRDRKTLGLILDMTEEARRG